MIGKTSFSICNPFSNCIFCPGIQDVFQECFSMSLCSLHVALLPPDIYMTLLPWTFLKPFERTLSIESIVEGKFLQYQLRALRISRIAPENKLIGGLITRYVGIFATIHAVLEYLYLKNNQGAQSSRRRFAGVPKRNSLVVFPGCQHGIFLKSVKNNSPSTVFSACWHRWNVAKGWFWNITGTYLWRKGMYSQSLSLPDKYKMQIFSSDVVKYSNWTTIHL